MNFEQSFKQSLEFLDELYDHDDFMESIRIVADMGAGVGLASEWWATRTTREEEKPTPLNIKVYAVDNELPEGKRVNHKNIQWLFKDFSDTGIKSNTVDIVWAHNCLQYSKNPLATLAHWYSIMKIDSMLCVSVPYNFGLYNFRGQPRVNSLMQPGCYYNYTPIQLILLLASSGFDCRGGHFKFTPDKPWIHAAVYKTEHNPQECMKWQELLGKKLLPISVEQAINNKSDTCDTDLLVEWIDHSIYNLSMQ